MSDHPQKTDQEPGQAPEPDLDELRARLSSLQHSVEQLGTEGAVYPPPPGPTGAGQPPAAHEQAAPAPGYPQPPAALGPEPAQQPHDYDYGAISESGEAGTQPQPGPPPAATNGHGDGSAGLAPPATVAYVDVGPFANLVELRRFEESVTALPAVRDLRVRRVAGGRAQVEVWMAGPYSLPRELHRLGVPLQVEPGPEGQILVELNPLREEQTAVGAD